jgi:TPR repeat protein
VEGKSGIKSKKNIIIIALGVVLLVFIILFVTSGPDGQEATKGTPTATDSASPAGAPVANEPDASQAVGAASTAPAPVAALGTPGPAASSEAGSAGAVATGTIPAASSAEGGASLEGGEASAPAVPNNEEDFVAVTPQLSGGPSIPERVPNRQVTPEEAVVIWTEMADGGDVMAMLNLARLYQNGVGTRLNHTKAGEMFQKAADANSPEGTFALAQAYEFGMGFAADDKKAWENYQKAAKLNFADANFRIAMAHAEGTFGLTQDEAKAFEFLLKADQGNSPMAAQFLGQVYLEGNFGQPRDQDKALASFTKGANQGNPDSMLSLGLMYHEGLGRPIDEVQALKWFILAQSLGATNQDWNSIFTSVRKNMTEEQIQQASQDAAAWFEELRAKLQGGNSEAAPAGS